MGAGPGAFGPYRHGNKFRVIVRAESAGPAVYESFESENAARQFIEDYRELHGTQIRTISEAIDSYAEHLADKGNSERSCTETPQKLRQFFEPSIDDALEILTHARCERLYDRVTKLKRTKAGPNKTRVETEHTIAAATHRQWLLEARSFTRWCVSKGWLKTNPLEKIQGKGKRNHGKPQLRIDDARVWTAKAMQLAESGDRGALGALMALAMGNRASEITRRKVGDVDNGCRQLWIGKVVGSERGKTDESNSAIPIPDDLRPLFKRLIKGRDRGEYLFPAESGAPHWRDWPRKNVQRICRLAGVPEVSAHGMRGLHSSVLYEEGAAGNVVMQSMRHTSETVTRTSYADKGSVRRGQQKRVLTVLSGGKR